MADEPRDDAQRFGGEFGPYRRAGTRGVSLGTFKTLVWTSNIGGLVLVAIAFELFFKEGNFWLGLFFMIAGMVVALFPSNYEIVGMGEDSDAPSDELDS